MLQSGYDTISPAVGTMETAKCRTCGDEMIKDSNVMGATSSIEAMAGRKHRHDRFTCPNAGLKWHDQIIGILKEIDKTASAKLTIILAAEVDEIRQHRFCTKENFSTW